MTSSRRERRVDILGAGGHASVVVDIAHRTGAELVTVWYEHEPDPSRFAHGTVLRAIADLPAKLPTLLGMGDIGARQTWRQRFPVAAGPLVDPSALIGHNVKLGDGVVVMPGCILNPNVAVEEDAIVNTGCIIEHDCRVGRNAHLSPGVTLSGGVTVGGDVHLGARAVVLPGITIGPRAVVGAGAVVTGPVRSGATVVGVPAREIDG